MVDGGVRSLLMTADAVGGVWTYAVDLSRALAARGMAVTLAVIGRTSQAQRRAARGIPLVEQDFKLEWMDDPWDDVRASGDWLLEVCARVRPDAVHLNGYAHAALPWPVPALVAGHSCVLSWYEAVRGERAPPRFDRYREEVSRGLLAARSVVAPTYAMLRELERFYGPLRGARAIWNARDPRLFEPGFKEPIVLAAGRLWDEAKNLRAVDEAAPACPWPVYVAGDARHPDGGEACAANVRLLGPLLQDELAVWMARASVYALPALYEPFGLSVLEAALSGCALVLGDITSLRELWAGTALFVDPRDPDALGAALRRLARDDSERERLAELARARARGMDLDLVAAQYLSAYRSLGAPGQRHRPAGAVA
jgi:glycosyltransferase involved in cell wall biosynthesis